MSCKLRSVHDYSSYNNVLEFLINLGYFVVIGGDLEHPPGIKFHPSIKSLSSFKSFIDLRLLNLFLLSSCDFILAHQSGPTYVAASAGVPQYISNAFPHCIGTLGANDVNLYKNLHLRSSLIPYEFVASDKHFRDFHFGCSSLDGSSYLDNSTQEIDSSFDVFYNKFILDGLMPSQFAKQQQLKSIVHKGSPVSFHNSMVANIL